MKLSILAAIAYGLLAIAGGVWGYIKSQSKASLISGSISGAGLLIAALWAWQGQKWGEYVCLAIVSLLVIVFLMRFAKTRKFMPAGLMILTGLATLAAMLWLA